MSKYVIALCLTEKQKNKIATEKYIVSRRYYDLRKYSFAFGSKDQLSLKERTHCSENHAKFSNCSKSTFVIAIFSRQNYNYIIKLQSVMDRVF